MQRRTSNGDVNLIAGRIVRETTGGKPESVKAVLAELEERLTEKQMRQLAATILGSKGGAKGGRARAKSLTAEKRVEIAKKAAQARWENRGKT